MPPLRSFSVSRTPPRHQGLAPPRALMRSLVLHAAHDGHTGRSSELASMPTRLHPSGPSAAGALINWLRRGAATRPAPKSPTPTPPMESPSLFSARTHTSRGRRAAAPGALLRRDLGAIDAGGCVGALPLAARSGGRCRNATFSFNATLPVIGGGACNRTSGFSSFLLGGGDGDADCRVACVVEGDARVSRGTTVLIASSSLSAGTFPAATVAATSAAARPSGITDLALVAPSGGGAGGGQLQLLRGRGRILPPLLSAEAPLAADDQRAAQRRQRREACAQDASFANGTLLLLSLLLLYLGVTACPAR